MIRKEKKDQIAKLGFQVIQIQSKSTDCVRLTERTCVLLVGFKQEPFPNCVAERHQISLGQVGEANLLFKRLQILASGVECVEENKTFPRTQIWNSVNKTNKGRRKTSWKLTNICRSRSLLSIFPFPDLKHRLLSRTHRNVSLAVC